MKNSTQYSNYFVSIIFIFLSFFLNCSETGQNNQSAAPIHNLSSDGFIRNWFILGMFPNPEDKLTSVDGGYQKDFLQSSGGEAKAILDYSTTIPYIDEEGKEKTAKVFSVNIKWTDLG